MDPGSTPVGAVGVGHDAQLVDSADEGTDEKKVDKCDEAGRVFGAAVKEEGSNCPCDSQGGHDEEDQELCGSAQVLAVVQVNEPGLMRVSREAESVDVDGLTSMPMVGMRVRICKNLQKMKEMPARDMAAS